MSKILSFCNHNKLAVVPQGGNTGVCGGCVPIFDEIIISAELLNEIIGFDELSGKIWVIQFTNCRLFKSIHLVIANKYFSCVENRKVYIKCMST